MGIECPDDYAGFTAEVPLEIKMTSARKGSSEYGLSDNNIPVYLFERFGHLKFNKDIVPENGRLAELLRMNRYGSSIISAKLSVQGSDPIFLSRIREVEYLSLKDLTNSINNL
ncbi:MAG: hypothetical protein AABW50_00590 [Nanoarchaeota archaeon]